jgi:hypothetical protein
MESNLHIFNKNVAKSYVMEMIMHIRKLVFYLKIFLDLPISIVGRKK